MDWKLEVVIVPVADIDRARQFYAEQVGFVVDHDTRLGESVALQLTPPGLAAPSSSAWHGRHAAGSPGAATGGR
jgi:catechol 2,3-dioxygenase-like lactoylglutathione lyase family enzyme